MTKSNSATVMYGSQNGVQADVTDWLNACFNIESFDHVTTHDTYQSFTHNEDNAQSSLRQRVAQSIDNYSSDVVVVVSHHDDEYASTDGSFGHLQKAMSSVAQWSIEADIIGLWVNEFGTIDMLMHHDQEKAKPPAITMPIWQTEAEESGISLHEDSNGLVEDMVEEKHDQLFGAAHLGTLTAAPLYRKLAQSNTQSSTDRAQKAA